MLAEWDLRGCFVTDEIELRHGLAVTASAFIYEGLHHRLRRGVAVKLLRIGARADQLAKDRLAREATIARHVDHPNVVRVFEHALVGPKGMPFLVMELIEGASLAQHLTRGALALPELRSLALELCAGLSAIHAERIVHRDIKPSNVLLARDGLVPRAKICDFGISRMEDVATIRVVGRTIGTPAYLAPEQLRGGEVDARADLYSMGILMFRAATGQLPYTVRRTSTGVRARGNPSLGALRAQDPELATIIERCWSEAPDARFSSADALTRALTAWEPACFALPGTKVAPLCSPSETEIGSTVATLSERGEPTFEEATVAPAQTRDPSAATTLLDSTLHAPPLGSATLELEGRTTRADAVNDLLSITRPLSEVDALEESPCGYDTERAIEWSPMTMTLPAPPLAVSAWARLAAWVGGSFARARRTLRLAT